MNNSPHHFRAVLGENLKILRLKADLSQEAAAELFGMTQPTFQRHEAGTTEAGIDFLGRVCEVFKVTPNQLLGIKGIEGMTPEAALAFLTGAGYKVTVEKRNT